MVTEQSIKVKKFVYGGRDDEQSQQMYRSLAAAPISEFDRKNFSVNKTLKSQVKIKL
jgi:hypothetical protein